MQQQNRAKVINRLALVLLSIVLLELLLIGDHQIECVKAIKKKILLKKLKKILPLLALIKPKKKLILVPIPIPMFHKQPNNYNNQQQPAGFGGSVGASRPMVMMSTEGSAPMTVISMGGAEAANELGGGGGGGEPALSMPQSMTMTISHQPVDGGAGTLELNTSVSAPSNSSALMLARRPNSQQSTKWQAIQQQQQQLFDQFDFEPIGFEQQQQPAGGEHYYSSPWSSGGGGSGALLSNRRPLASPAKLLRNERFRHQQQQPPQSQQQQQPLLFRAPRPLASMAPQFRLPTLSRLREPLAPATPAPMVPVLVIKNQWHPSGSAGNSGSSNPTQQQQQQLQAREQEFVQVGPARLLPIYQTANGQLHMTPPPLINIARVVSAEKQQRQQQPQFSGKLSVPPSPPSPPPMEQELDSSSGAAGHSGDANPNAEVQTIGSADEQTFGELVNAGRNQRPAPTPSTSPPSLTNEQHQHHHQQQQQPPHPHPEPWSEPRGRAPTSPVKAKQQQHLAPGQRRPISGGGY